MRSPSSLIFLVLIGVWAAYFVQFWIRRRDHLATARSVEQFSAAMRVLERRTPIPRTDLSDPAPRSWAVHPRRARPEVVVKRATTMDMAAGPDAVARTAAAPVDPRPDVRPSTPRPQAPAARRPAPRRAAERRRVRPSRRVRALVLLLSLVSVVATAVVGVLGYLSLWSPGVAGGVVILSFFWVRSAVRAEQAIRAARRRRAVHEARRRAGAVPVAAARRTAGRPAAEAAPEVAAETTTVAERQAEVPQPAAVGPVTASEVAADDAAVEPQPEAPVEVVAEVAPEPEPEPVIEYVHLVDEDDIPLMWEPVPVPRPTYTMKAKAERPEVAPAEVTPGPAPVQTPLRAREDDLDERRVAGA